MTAWDGRRRLATAAVGSAALLLTAACTLASADGSAGDGGSDQRVGRQVLIARLTEPGTTITHTAYLTRGADKGLSLCYSLETAASSGSGDDAAASSAGSGGCTAAGPPIGRAIRVLTGARSTGALDTPVRTFTGATTLSVASVRALTSDGHARRLPLHRLGAGGLQAFGYTATGSAQPVVRLLAYDEDDGLLQTVDVDTALGGSWLAGS